MDSSLQGKKCTLNNLRKATHLNGQTSTVLKWVEDIRRFKVRLSNGSEVAVKFENFELEGDLKPFLWKTTIRDQMGMCIEKSLQLAVHEHMLQEGEFANLSRLTCFFEFSVIKDNNFICSSNDKCNEKAVTCVTTPHFFKQQEDHPAMLINSLCIPICGKAGCENHARRQTDRTTNAMSRESKQKGLSYGSREGQRRECNNCMKLSTQKGEYMKCSGCKAAFYCSKKCQLDDWKYHEQNCK